MTQHALDDRGCRLGFVYTPELVGPDGRVLRAGPPTKNLIPQVGVNHLAGLIRGTISPISNWYVGLFEGNFVPGNGTTSDDLPVNALECLAYSETARPLWDNEFDGDTVITNIDNRVEYTMTADKRIYGAFLVSSSAKGGNSGTLLSIARFPTPYDPPSGSTFRLGVSIVLVPSI